MNDSSACKRLFVWRIELSLQLTCIISHRHLSETSVQDAGGTGYQAGINMVRDFFSNLGNSEQLLIEVRVTSSVPSLPVGYNPGSFHTFTYIYGRGNQYNNVNLSGKSRRRLGGASMGVGTRDYTVFTINWHGSGAV